MPPLFEPGSVIVQGMHGLGDNVMTRAGVRKLLAEIPGTIYLETPWPAIFTDLESERLKLVFKMSRLRTQAKNAKREFGRFYKGVLPGARTIRPMYRGVRLREQDETVLAELMRSMGVEPANADFRIPMRADWAKIAADYFKRIGADGKPVLFYRPATLRTEWLNASRNPEPQAYAALLAAIRKDFFVLSVADLIPNVEWIDGVRVSPDAAFHNGELSIEVIMAIMAHSALVYCAPGFSTVLAMALGVPCVTVFGGYQSGRSLQFAPPSSPSLFVEPVKPCECFRHDHRCTKAIDLTKWTPLVKTFAELALTYERGPG